MKNNKSLNGIFRFKIFWFVLLIGILVIGFFVWNKYSSDSVSQTPNAEPGSVADVSRPTEEEKLAGDIQKNRNLERKETDSRNIPTNGDKKEITPFITFAEQTSGNVEVGGLITGIYEDGGICTLTATNGSAKITKQSPARKNPTTTDCIPFSIPESEFSPRGTWTLQIFYNSAAAYGSSQTKDMSIK